MLAENTFTSRHNVQMALIASEPGMFILHIDSPKAGVYHIVGTSKSLVQALQELPSKNAYSYEKFQKPSPVAE